MKLRKLLPYLMLWGFLAQAASNLKGLILNAPTDPVKNRVETLIKEQIATKTLRAPSDFDVSIDQLNFVPAVQAGEKDVEVLSILGLGSEGSQRLDGLFVVDAVVKSSLGIQDKKLTGLLKVIGPAVVARR